jgi:hypothetical protein
MTAEVGGLGAAVSDGLKREAPPAMAGLFAFIGIADLYPIVDDSSCPD